MKNISRDSVFTISFTQLSISFLIRGACFSFLIFPAMFFSCTPTINQEGITDNDYTKYSIEKVASHEPEITTLDAFFFENDSKGRLDCYQRISYPESTCNLASGCGPKTLVLIANSKKDKYEWADIKSLKTITDITIDLEDERLDKPVMTSLQQTMAGQEISLDLSPLMCEIVVRSIRCDFSRQPYSQEQFTLSRIFLTYVNASCSIIPDEQIQPSRIINAGMLDEAHLQSFYEKDIIVKNIDSIINKEKTLLNCSLFCYANNPTEESIGSPFTKLVIEGKIGNDTYYYPIRINSHQGGITRGESYVFDIAITRAGVTDPDGELGIGGIDIKMEIEPWKEKDWYTVNF